MFILCLTDHQEGYRQFFPDQEKADAVASRSAWAHKPQYINGRLMLLYGMLSTNVDDWSLHVMKSIALGCDSSCHGLGVISYRMKMEMSAISLTNLCFVIENTRDGDARPHLAL